MVVRFDCWLTSFSCDAFPRQISRLHRHTLSHAGVLIQDIGSHTAYWAQDVIEQSRLRGALADGRVIDTVLQSNFQRQPQQGETVRRPASQRVGVRLHRRGVRHIWVGGRWAPRGGRAKSSIGGGRGAASLPSGGTLLR